MESEFYMGREISKVMGHLGAGCWAPKRVQQERTDLRLKILSLNRQPCGRPGSRLRILYLPDCSPRTEGKSLCGGYFPIDAGIVRAKMQKQDYQNVETVHSTITDLKLENNLADCVLIVDAYHEFSHPMEMGEAIYNTLKPGGKLVLIEYRMEDPGIPIKKLHKMSEKQAIKELSATGLEWVKTSEALPQQHFIVFRKP